MATVTDVMTSPLRRLISVQGLLTLLGLITGLAAIVLPVGLAGPKGDPIGVLPVFGESVKHYQQSGLDFLDYYLLEYAAIFPLLLPIPIAAGYLKMLVTGRLAPQAWRMGYPLAVLAAVVLLAGSVRRVFLMFAAPGTINVAIELPAYVCAFTALALGAWLVIQNRQVGVPHALNALVALQVVYVAAALDILISLQPQGFMGILISTWFIGAPFALFTMATYVVQMTLVRRRRGAIDHSVRSTTSL